MTRGVHGAKVSKSIRGEAHLLSKDLYKKQAMVMTVYFHGRIRQSNKKGSEGSTKGRIWGTKFQEIYIYKGCRNKYITLNDNRCKHIP